MELKTYFATDTDGKALPQATNEYQVLYQNVAGAAVKKGSYPSAKALSEVISDPQRPQAMQLKGNDEDILAAFLDANNNRTWLEARSKDGGPTQWALRLLREALGTLAGSYPGMLMAVADSNGVLTDLAVRDTDGQVPDWVIERWAKRITPLLNVSKLKSTPDYFLPDVRGTNSVLLGTDSYVRDGEVLPVLPNMQKWTGWGSSTIAQFTEMGDIAVQFGATYYNGGQGSEASTHCAARMGSVPALLTVPSGVIPAAAGSALAVTCSNVAYADYFRATDGYLNGVKGTLRGTTTGFTFTRSTAGLAVQTAGEFAFIPVDGPDHRADVTFLNMGKNDINYGLGSSGVIERINRSYEWLSPLVKRVIVVGQFKNPGTAAGSAAAVSLTEIDDHCRKRYGRQFFDLGAYLTGSQVWSDTAITPTSADLAQQAIGNLPPSLSSDGVAHMNAAARGAVSKKIKALITQLGWY